MVKMEFRWEDNCQEMKRTMDDLAKEIRSQEDMLKGNLARMFLSDSIEEIENMKTWAHKRIDKIANIKLQIIQEGANNEQ